MAGGASEAHCDHGLHQPFYGHRWRTLWRKQLSRSIESKDVVCSHNTHKTHGCFHVYYQAPVSITQLQSSSSSSSSSSSAAAAASSAAAAAAAAGEGCSLGCVRNDKPAIFLSSGRKRHILDPPSIRMPVGAELLPSSVAAAAIASFSAMR